MKLRIVFMVLSMLFILSCKKAENRGCFKSYGAVTEIEFNIDSVQEFRLFKGIVYNLYQDTLRKIIIKGGANVIGFVGVNQENYTVSINNLNSCNFLRKYDDKITVEIHYPHYKSIYAEPTENMKFVDTLRGDETKIELRNGGANLELCVDVNKLYLDVTLGTGSINVAGRTNYLKLATLNLGRINALNILADEMFIYQHSATDMRVNLTNSNVKVYFGGNGDVRYIGEPALLEISGEGDGEVITF